MLQCLGTKEILKGWQSHFRHQKLLPSHSYFVSVQTFDSIIRLTIKDFPFPLIFDHRKPNIRIAILAWNLVTFSILLWPSISPHKMGDDRSWQVSLGRWSHCWVIYCLVRRLGDPSVLMVWDGCDVLKD